MIKLQIKKHDSWWKSIKFVVICNIYHPSLFMIVSCSFYLASENKRCSLKFYEFDNNLQWGIAQRIEILNRFVWKLFIWITNTLKRDSWWMLFVCCYNYNWCSVNKICTFFTRKIHTEILRIHQRSYMKLYQLKLYKYVFSNMTKNLKTCQMKIWMVKLMFSEYI